MKINGKEIGFLEVVRYGFEYHDGKPSIIIHQVKVCDTEGKYIKFAKLKDLEPYLSEFEIHFKPLEI